MRIGLLTDVYRIGFSGVANHVFLLKKALQARGEEVYVFAFERPNKLPHRPDVIYSPGITLAADYPFGLRVSRGAAALLESMDILHVHQPYASGTVALRASKKKGIPVVFTNHTRYDLYNKAYLPLLPYSFATGIVRAYIGYFSRHLRLIISPSQEVQNLLKTWQVQAPIITIPNGIDLHAFSLKQTDQRTLRQKLNLPEEAFLFAFVGRMANEKNIPFLLKSFELVFQSYPQSMLLLIGSGPKTGKFQNAIYAAGLGDAVRMTGAVHYTQIPDYLHAVNAFVTASKTEVHPLSVIEASASGLPVVGLDAPGVAEVVVDGETGLICPEDPLAFASKMLLLARQPEVCNMLGAKAMQAAREYSYERTAERIFEQYQAVLNAN